MSTPPARTGRPIWRRRPTPAFVLAAAALFVALGSVAQATHPGGANTISAGDIIDGEVRQPEIQNGAVTTADISNSNGVRSEDVRDDTLAGGGLTSSDVAADALGGADINEASLSFECPAGLTLASRDVCFGVEQPAADHPTASSTCVGSGARLPTVAEAELVMATVPDPATGTNRTWTTDYTAGNAVILLGETSSGTITRANFLTTTTNPYRCVTSPHG